MKKIKRTARKFFILINRLRLRNRNFSLFASNCNGCIILHELGMRFNSPFVNLWISADDFIRFLQNPQHYLNHEMDFEQSSDAPYPIGIIDDIRLHLVHYKTHEEARNKWKERASRIDMNNLFIMFTDRDGCTMEHLRAFDALPYPNKVVFTHVPHPEIKSAYYIKGFENESCVGEMYTYRSRWSIKKYYDSFDYISWFNKGRSINRKQKNPEKDL